MRRPVRNGITMSVEGGTGFVELHGEVDITAVTAIEHAVSELIERPVELIVFDFGDAAFADSKIIEAVMRSGRAAELAGVRVAGAGATGPVGRAIEVCGLEHAMRMYATRGDATGAPPTR